MTDFYQTVYFRPKLTLDWRVPVAALLSGGPCTQTVTAELLPDPRCLGGSAVSELLQFGVAALSRAKGDSLPRSLGPHFEIGPRETLPEGVDDAAGWVRRTALPRTQEIQGEVVNSIPAARVQTVAWEHLSTWGVSGYVKKRFRPKDAPELARMPVKVGTVTHYVPGSKTILLMEPLILTNAGVDERVAKLYQKFSAYSHAWDASQGREHQLLAYVLPGPYSNDEYAVVADQLAPVATIFNTRQTQRREKLTSKIRAIGDTGPRPELVG